MRTVGLEKPINSYALHTISARPTIHALFFPLSLVGHPQIANRTLIRLSVHHEASTVSTNERHGT